MKIYTFRTICSKEDRMYYQENINDMYPLYAFTTKKKFAKKFKAQRNMDKYLSIIIERDGMDADQWIDCHRSKKLDMYRVETYINKNTDSQDIRLAYILATDSEITFLSESVESGGILTKLITGYVPIDIFSSKVMDALTAIGYDQAWNYYSQAVLPILENDFGDNFKYEDCSIGGFFNIQDIARNITIDQLGAFIIIYNELLSENFYIDTKITPYEE